MGVCVTIALTARRQRSRRESTRASRAAGRPPKLDHPVTHQIESGESPGVNGQVVNDVKKDVCYRIVRIFGELIPGDPQRQHQEIPLRHQAGGDAGHHFRKRKDCLEPQAQFEDPVSFGSHRVADSRIRGPRFCDFVAFAGSSLHGCGRNGPHLVTGHLFGNHQHRWTATIGLWSGRDGRSTSSPKRPPLLVDTCNPFWADQT